MAKDEKASSNTVARLASQLKDWLQARDRRGDADRRSWRPIPSLPFKDQHGFRVTKDRRKAPDRRVNNIEVTWQNKESQPQEDSN